ncbi:MAG: hypothetical protein ACYDH1_19550 [Anaerolineaceae bacterium]
MSIESELNNEIRNSQAIIYYDRLEAIKLNFYVFNKNFIELKTPLENMKDPNKSIPLWDVSKRSELEQIQYEVIRRLLNYIFSAKALVDYTRNLINDWYINTDFKKEYDTEIKKRFIENDLCGFMEDLRNYSAHYSLPITRPSFSVINMNSKNQKFEHKFIMSKSVLLRWKNWDKGKKYLNGAPENIEIEIFSYAYFSLIDSFDHWLYRKLVAIHKNDLDWLTDKSQQLHTLVEKSFK